MAEGAIDSNLADLKEDIYNGQRTKSNKSNDEEQTSTSSPELNAVSIEMQAIEVGLDDEPSPQGVLAKTVSRTNPRISVDLEPPPDGVLMAWTRKS